MHPPPAEAEVSTDPTESPSTRSPSSWGRADALAIAAWTIAVVLVFREAATLRGALFYFDVTELNYPYRAFLFRELAAGRFSRWLPDLYCGMPLFSESQAGYFHPIKYLLYPWMAAWKAFNLDTVLSIWLTGIGAYGWLRRHVGSIGSLAGASIVALGGYTWAHLIHTSMVNALVSVPFSLWALESSWGRGRFRAMSLGAFAIAFQVFAGHLQDTILTGSALGCYALIRASGERSWKSRIGAIALTVGMISLGGLIASIQWVPSKELLDRSPRAGGLTNDDLTYGSWHPELLPALLVHEAYGSRARDTDWMDGFYPYHEMDAYLGVVGLFLAAVGAAKWRDRWVGSWLGIASIGVLLMLGRHTFLMDLLHKVPIVGSSRIPVRFHLWVTLAVAALAAVGADRLAKGGPIRLRWPVSWMAMMAVASLVILAWTYSPIVTQSSRWTQAEHARKFGWLGREVGIAAARNVLIFGTMLAAASNAIRSSRPSRRLAWASLLPILSIVDMASAHAQDCPTVDPSYWADAPASVSALKADPRRIRIYGEGTYSSGEPGYASKPIDFLAVRETLAWSLPAAWDLKSAGGHTPLISRRRFRFGEWDSAERFDLEGLSHVLSTTPSARRLGAAVPAGRAFIHYNPRALPRARFVGEPAYATDERDAMRLMKSLGADARRRVVVESVDRPVASTQVARGSARIVSEIPERVEVAVRAETPGFLLLSDTYDPGWSATVDGRAATISPANVAFRAVALPEGDHSVVFAYRPAGFLLGMALTAIGIGLAVASLVVRSKATEAPASDRPWGRSWPILLTIIPTLILAGSVLRVGPGASIGVQSRWSGTFHPFTWGAKIEAIKPPPPPIR